MIWNGSWKHPPDQATVTLSLTEDLFQRSFTWARWQLGIPLTQT